MDDANTDMVTRIDKYTTVSVRAARNAEAYIGAAFGTLPADNEPLAIGNRDEFTRWILSRAGSFPEAYRTIKAVNVGLMQPDADTAEELEGGKNQCAAG